MAGPSFATARLRLTSAGNPGQSPCARSGSSLAPAAGAPLSTRVFAEGAVERGVAVPERNQCDSAVPDVQRRRRQRWRLGDVRLDQSRDALRRSRADGTDEPDVCEVSRPAAVPTIHTTLFPAPDTLCATARASAVLPTPASPEMTAPAPS